MSKSVIPYLRSEPLWYHVSLGSYHIGASSGQCWRCSMNTKNACCLSKHSSLNICTPRSFQAIDSLPLLLLALSSVHLSHISSSLFSLLPVPKPVFLRSLPRGEGALRLTGSVTDSSHSTLLSHSASLLILFPYFSHKHKGARAHICYDIHRLPK